MEAVILMAFVLDAMNHWMLGITSKIEQVAGIQLGVYQKKMVGTAKLEIVFACAHNAIHYLERIVLIQFH
ncbi:hypothetical protein ACFLTO_00450 [Chloroflexota bacterium]